MELNFILKPDLSSFPSLAFIRSYFPSQFSPIVTCAICSSKVSSPIADGCFGVCGNISNFVGCQQLISSCGPPALQVSDLEKVFCHRRPFCPSLSLINEAQGQPFLYLYLLSARFLDILAGILFREWIVTHPWKCVISSAFVWYCISIMTLWNKYQVRRWH